MSLLVVSPGEAPKQTTTIVMFWMYFFPLLGRETSLIPEERSREDSWDRALGGAHWRRLVA